MASTLNLSLTDELREFIDKNTGDGTSYATPSELVRALIRDMKERKEAAELRQAIFEGFTDVAADRTIDFEGSISDLLQKGREKQEEGWE